MPNKSIQNINLPYRKTLSWKLVRIYAIIVVIGSTVHLTAFLMLHSLFIDKHLQITNWGVAEEYAREIGPYTSPVYQEETIEAWALRERLINPTRDIYLLDSSGNTLFFGSVNDCSLPVLGHIQKFLSTKGFPLLPIYGLDIDDCGWRSKHLNEATKVPFSAARIKIKGKPGYLYVNLHGTLYQETYHALGDFSLSLVSILFFAVLSCFTVFLAVLMSRFLTRRFNRLTFALSEFSEGDLGIRVEDQTNDDLGLQSRVFNEMAQTIQDNIAKLEHGDKMRRELVANISHDLKTPVSAMQLLLETLQKRVLRTGDEEQLSFIERAVANCGELGSLIDDLFELSKLDTASESLDAKPLELRELLRQVVRNHVSLAEDKKIAISLDCPGELPMALVDQKLLLRAVSNLVTNSIRYTQSGGEVRIAAEQLSASEIRLSVSDNGPGIAEEELPRVFDRFYRGSQEGKQRVGSGLGLAIVKRIVELHGHGIFVESTVGQGTVFSFTLSASSLSNP